MAYDEGLAERLREMFEDVAGVAEKRMFGGLAFMVRGNMSCGVIGDELMVRVGKDAYETALQQHGAREMDFTGRPMRGLVMVEAEGIGEDAVLRDWIDMSLAFVDGLPSK